MVRQVSLFIRQTAFTLSVVALGGVYVFLYYDYIHAAAGTHIAVSSVPSPSPQTGGGLGVEIARASR